VSLAPRTGLARCCCGPTRAARASVSPVSRCAPGRGLPIAQSAPPPGPHAAGPRPHGWQPKTPPQAKPTLRHTTPTGGAVPGRSVVRKHVWHDCKRRAVTSPRWRQCRGGMTVMRRARNHPAGRSRRPRPQIILGQLLLAVAVIFASLTLVAPATARPLKRLKGTA
jgi:hypothetical protein